MVVGNILYLLFKICCVWCFLFLKTICFTCGSLKLKWNAHFGAFEKKARQLPCCTTTPRSKSKQKTTWHKPLFTQTVFHTDVKNTKNTHTCTYIYIYLWAHVLSMVSCFGALNFSFAFVSSCKIRGQQVKQTLKMVKI